MILPVVTDPKAFGIIVHADLVTLGHILSAPAVKPTFYIPRRTARGPTHCLRDLIPLFYRQITHFALFGRQLSEFTKAKNVLYSDALRGAVVVFIAGYRNYGFPRCRKDRMCFLVNYLVRLMSVTG